MNSKEWKKWLFWFSFAVAAIIVYKTIDSVTAIFSWVGNLFNLLMPFFMALLIAYILYMPSKKIENGIKKIKFKIFKNHARGLSVLCVYILTILIILLIINVVMPTISTSIKDLANNLPNYYNSALEYFNNLDEDSILSKIKINEQIKKLQNINFEEEILKYANIDNIASVLGGLLGATNVIFDLFVTIVVSVYMLLERSDIKSFLQNLSKAIFDKKTNETIARYYRKTNSIFFSFITSQLLDAIIVGIVTGIAMSIMKVKYAVLLGFLIGLFNIIPYFGAIVAVIIAVIITIFTGGFIQAIWLAVVVVALQQIDANIINPKILGNSLNLSPILVIFAVTVGGAYFGVLGMFLGVPVIAFIKIILEDFILMKNGKLEENSKK
ncbi:MAG TPA: AI-2E family transporter [Candidatus Scatovivens faecipullorum]|nr:AI-2E family transporter [Candidatus Scatovivens faecipullorum]